MNTWNGGTGVIQHDRHPGQRHRRHRVLPDRRHLLGTGSGRDGHLAGDGEDEQDLTLTFLSGPSSTPTGGTYTFVANGGFSVPSSGTNPGLLVVGSGSSTVLTPFTYTGISGVGTTMALTGVVVSGAGGTVAAGANCFIPLLGSPQTGQSGGGATNAWPLQYSSTAYTYVGVGASSTYATAQANNANANLNTMLDQMANLAGYLSTYNVTMQLRLYFEANRTKWYNQTWYPQLWRYSVAYLTGNPSHAYSCTVASLVLTPSSMTGLKVGQLVTGPGLTGQWTITAVGTSTVTIAAGTGRSEPRRPGRSRSRSGTPVNR